MTMIRRSSWIDPKYPVTGPKVDLSAIDQIVIHYPGVDPGDLNLDNPVGVLRNTHLFYLNKKDKLGKPAGYSIGYSFATFPSGRFELRGFDIKNAANKGHNDHTLSINCMVNGADPMPESQLEYTREMVQEIWDALGRQVPLIRHRDLSGAATACPGAGITAQLAAGLLLPRVVKPPPPPETPPIVRPPTPEEDDMVITNSEEFFGNPPGNWKGFIVPETGIPRHMRSGEWEARRQPAGEPMNNEQLARLFAGT